MPATGDVRRAGLRECGRCPMRPRSCRTAGPICDHRGCDRARRAPSPIRRAAALRRANPRRGSRARGAGRRGPRRDRRASGHGWRRRRHAPRHRRPRGRAARPPCRPRGGWRAGPRHQRHGRDRPHEPWACAMAGGRHPGRRGRDPRAAPSWSWTRRLAGADAAYRAAEEHLLALSGAEDALVTNNCAAALVLAVGLAGRKGVVVGRGELVEIGGGVRIPEIVRRAGARLVEVGTTNRTRVGDYEAPLREGRAALVLRVHPSNFTMAGFTESPDPAELAALAHAHGALVVDDLGSGALLDTAAFGLAHEPTPAERLAAGADLVALLRRQARRRAPGGAGRRPRGPRRPPPQGSAGARDAPRQGDPRRRGRHPRPLPGGAGDPGDPGLADDRDAAGRPAGAGGGAGGSRAGGRDRGPGRDDRRGIAAGRDAAVLRDRRRRTIGQTAARRASAAATRPSSGGSRRGGSSSTSGRSIRGPTTSWPGRSTGALAATGDAG